MWRWQVSTEPLPVSRSYANGELQIEVDGGVVKLLINRPHKANALSSPILEGVLEVLEQCINADSVVCVLITGSGERAFSGGADLAEMARSEGDPNYAEQYYGLWERVTTALEASPLFTIALINGACVAGGLSLALACDVRIATKRAFLSYPRVAQGHLPGKFNLTRLVGLVGKSRAKLMLLGSRRVSASEAQLWGLVDSLVDADNAWQCLEDMLAPLRESNATLLKASKSLFQDVDDDAAWEAAASILEELDAPS